MRLIYILFFQARMVANHSMNGYLVQIPPIRTFEIMGGGWSATFLFQFSNTFPDSLIPESGLKVLVLDQARPGSHTDSDAWPRRFPDPWSLSKSGAPLIH